jgi:hypothetical protein
MDHKVQKNWPIQKLGINKKCVTKTLDKTKSRDQDKKQK